MSRSAPPPEPGALTPTRLRQVLDALEEGVAILSAAGVVEFVNRRGQEILHVPALDVVGQHLLDFRWNIFDESGAPVPRESHPALRVLETGEPSTRVVLGMEAPSVGEGTLWVEVVSTPLPPEAGNGPPGSLSTFRDVSARVAAQAALRESELRFETLVDSVDVGIFHARDGRCVWTNRAWTAISGQTPEDAMGTGWERAIHPDDLPRLWEERNAAVERDEPCTLEYRVRRPNGEVRWVLCRIAAIPDEAGGTSGYLGSVIDVTEAREAAGFKGQVIGLVSHELRAPLISIRSGLTFLAPYIAKADADGQRLYDIAVRNAELLERLVTDLLDIERLEAGRVTLNRKDTDVGAVLEDARVLALPGARERGVLLAPVGDAALTVRMDHDRILQVLTNLLSNAIKFSEPGGVIRMEAFGDRAGVIFSVSDEGRGIPEGDTERIFERFVQVHPSDAADRGGAGLGLAISRAIVGCHGGRIWVESAEGTGSTFRFLVPAKAATV